MMSPTRARKHPQEYRRLVLERLEDRAVPTCSLDTPGVSFGAGEKLMGFRGIPSADIYLDEVRVPASNVVVDAGGFHKLFGVFSIERLGNATMSLAIGQASLDRTVAYVEQRHQFGRPLVEFQNVQMTVASLQESVTVSGESPVVDTSTTTIGTNFTKELLTQIPNARDIWAAMAQAPGFQVTGYDVGGSHTGTQTGYITYGVSQQNTTRIEGVNTSEGTSANAGYFDFGSFEEFQLGGAGNGADQDVPGASLNITVKSGGNRFQGMYYTDFENNKTISDNVPTAFKTQFQKDENGFFTRAPGGLERGNPIDRNLRRNRITMEELAAQARMQQVAHIGDIEWAVLETSGNISVIPKTAS